MKQTNAEKNLAAWSNVFGATPSKAELKLARASEINFSQTGADIFTVESQNPIKRLNGVTYRVTVSYAGESAAVIVNNQISFINAHGCEFIAGCTCPDALKFPHQNCKHALAVLNFVNDDWDFAFGFFGLETEANGRAPFREFAEMTTAANKAITESKARLAA